MLQISYDSADKFMPVPYPAKPPTGNGYIECRGQPDRAAAISEAAGSALRDLLVTLAQPNAPLFSVGCDLGQLRGEDVPWLASGYVQVAFPVWLLPANATDDEHVIFLFPEDLFHRHHHAVTEIGQQIARLMESKAGEHDWRLRISCSPIVLHNDKASPEWLEYCADYLGEEEMEAATAALSISLTLYFAAGAETEQAAVASREVMISKLHEVLQAQEVRSLVQNES